MFLQGCCPGEFHKVIGNILCTTLEPVERMLTNPRGRAEQGYAIHALSSDYAEIYPNQPFEQ
jgi:hypothetical protein